MVVADLEFSLHHEHYLVHQGILLLNYLAIEKLWLQHSQNLNREFFKFIVSAI